MKFSKLCDVLLVKRLHFSAYSVREIAKKTGKAESTIRRWIKL